jgi:hypothetical protein
MQFPYTRATFKPPDENRRISDTILARRGTAVTLRERVGYVASPRLLVDGRRVLPAGSSSAKTSDNPSKRETASERAMKR